jgi:predicted metal-dependent hydrolase
MAESPPITVRRPEFSYPRPLDPVVFEGQPELSYVAVGLSLLLPYLEPYLIRTMSEAKRRVADPELAEQIARFNGQEGQHYRQHLRFNEAVRAGLPELAALEAELARDYERFTEARPLRWNLAYAEGFEAFTTAVARFFDEVDLLRGAQPAVRELFEWHLLEELEHRCVAFDAYERAYGGYLYRLAVGTFAQWHLLRFVRRVVRAMGEQDREAGREHGGPAAARARVRPLLWLTARRLGPKVLYTYLPWYTPHRISVSDDLAARVERYATPGRGGRAEAPPARP